MFRPQHPAAEVERFPIQLLRFGVATFQGQNKGQVVHQSQGLRILRPEDTAVEVERFPTGEAIQYRTLGRTFWA